MHHDTGAHPSLRTPEAVWALREILGDDDLVHKVATTFPTWARFAASSHAELMHYLGNKVPVIPAQMPQPPRMPAGVSVLCRYQPTYPPLLRESTSPPALLYVTGSLPTTPALSIIGATNPTAVGVEVSRAAARAAAETRVPISISIASGCGLAAAKEALDAGGQVIAVLPHGLATGSAHQLFLEQVLENRGAVVSPFSPTVQLRESTEEASACVAALIGQAALLAEVGTFPAAAEEPTKAVVTAGRYLIVPSPSSPPESGRYIAPSAFGTAIFSSAREFSPEYFGTSHRITQRCENGLTPADSVVSTPGELSDAIRIGCAAPTFG